MVAMMMLSLACSPPRFLFSLLPFVLSRGSKEKWRGLQRGIRITLVGSFLRREKRKKRCKKIESLSLSLPFSFFFLFFSKF